MIRLTCSCSHSHGTERVGMERSRANFSVVARCEVHGTAVKPGMKAGEKQYMSAFALNEWDSKLAGGVEWRQKIDTQVRSVACSMIYVATRCYRGTWSS